MEMLISPFSNLIKLSVATCFSSRIKCAKRDLKKRGPAIAEIADKIKKSVGKKEGEVNFANKDK